MAPSETAGIPGTKFNYSESCVEASKRIRNENYSSRNMEDAIARMYEKIAQDLFEPQLDPSRFLTRNPPLL